MPCNGSLTITRNTTSPPSTCRCLTAGITHRTGSRTTAETASRVTKLIGQLTAMNIPVIAATGNSFNGQQGEGFAAIVAGTISVTATDLSGNLLSNAQRLGTAVGGASATTIAAPGEGLTAPTGDSGTSTVEGTSFATALVSGGVTLLQQIYQSRFGSLPTVAQIKNWIQQSATPVYDPTTGITIGELNLTAAAALIPTASPASTPSAPVTTTSTATAARRHRHDDRHADASANRDHHDKPDVDLVDAGHDHTDADTDTAATTTSSATTTTSTSSSSSSAPTTVASTSSVLVYINGQPVNTAPAAQTNSTSSIDLSAVEALLPRWVLTRPPTPAPPDREPPSFKSGTPSPSIQAVVLICTPRRWPR